MNALVVRKTQPQLRMGLAWEDAMETDQKRQSWLVPLGEPTLLDWYWLILTTLGMAGPWFIKEPRPPNQGS
jgi:hypothetical protein